MGVQSELPPLPKPPDPWFELSSLPVRASIKAIRQSRTLAGGKRDGRRRLTVRAAAAALLVAAAAVVASSAEAFLGLVDVALALFRAGKLLGLHVSDRVGVSTRDCEGMRGGRTSSRRPILRRFELVQVGNFSRWLDLYDGKMKEGRKRDKRARHQAATINGRTRGGEGRLALAAHRVTSPGQGATCEARASQPAA